MEVTVNAYQKIFRHELRVGTWRIFVLIILNLFLASMLLRSGVRIRSLQQDKAAWELKAEALKQDKAALESRVMVLEEAVIQLHRTKPLGEPAAKKPLIVVEDGDDKRA